MQAAEIEIWARKIIDQIKVGQIVEDSLVEFKAEWPTDINKQARRLGGHANASGGEKIMWLIGVDEKRGIVGVKHDESWYQKIKNEFDEEAPRLVRDLAITVDGKAIIALLFETDRCPYSVKNEQYGNGGSVEFETPWREGTIVRTARRSELLTILAPRIEAPKYEFFSPELEMFCDEKKVASWKFKMPAYIIPANDKKLALPFHKAIVELTVGDIVIAKRLYPIKFVTIKKTDYSGAGPSFKVETLNDSLTLDESSTELIVSGPGRFTVVADTKMLNFSKNVFAKHIPDASIKISISAAGYQNPYTYQMVLKPDTATNDRSKVIWHHPQYMDSTQK